MQSIASKASLEAPPKAPTNKVPGAADAGRVSGEPARAVTGTDWEDGAEAEEFKSLTREEAQQWRARQPRSSVWVVVAWQVLLGVLAVVLAYAVTRSASVTGSLAYGALAVVLPSALMAWGLTSSALSRRLAGQPNAQLAGFFVWEGAKVLLALALLAMAPQVVPDLNWLALVAGLVVVLKAYWLELLLRARRSN